MILTDDQIQERIESPLNLLNRLKTTLGRAANSQSIIPSLPPKAEDIVADLEDKLKNTATRTRASSIMLSAMNELERRLPEVQRPEKLSEIAYNMSKVISNHESKNGTQTVNSQIIVYAPQIQKLDSFDIVDVTE